MKQYIALLAISLFLVGFTNMNYITTNFNDLKISKEPLLKQLLHTQDLHKLNENSIDIITDFLKTNLLYDNKEKKTNVYVDKDYIKQRYFINIYNELPDFVNEKERHRGYYVENRSEDESNQLLAYTIFRINRSPENIKKIYYLIGSTLLDAIDPHRYESLGIKDFVDMLVETHNKIITIEGYKDSLLNVFAITDSIAKNYEKVDYYGHGISDDFHIYNESFSLVNGDIRDYSELVYCYSFWVRRYHEGNMDVVFDILLKIQEKYAEDLKSQNDAMKEQSDNEQNLEE